MNIYPKINIGGEGFRNSNVEKLFFITKAYKQNFQTGINFTPKSSGDVKK